jgi:hypothetical protein
MKCNEMKEESEGKEGRTIGRKGVITMDEGALDAASSVFKCCEYLERKEGRKEGRKEVKKGRKEGKEGSEGSEERK